MPKLNRIQKKDMLEELKKQEALMDMDVLHYKDNDQRRQDNFQKTILAIQSIVNRKLYKAVAPSLEIYFRDVWNISRAQVYRFLDCATVLNTLEGFKERPSKERLCRSLKRHGKSPNNIRNLWTLVKIRASDREITSTLIGKCWEEIVATGKEIVEAPIPKKKECKPRKPKINLTINPNTITFASSNPSTNVMANKSLTSNSQVKINTNLVPSINTSFSSPSIITLNNNSTTASTTNTTSATTNTVLPVQKNKISINTNITTSSLGTPLMNTTFYDNITLPTPTTIQDQDQQIPEPLYSSNNENDKKMLLQSLPTPTISSSKTLYQSEGQSPLSNTNSLNNTILSSEINATATTTTTGTTVDDIQKQNEKKIISSYPSPTASHALSQQVNQYTTTNPTSQYVIEQQNISPIQVQKVNFPLGSVLVNPSPSTTPLVDTTIVDSLPQPNQQIILNDVNNSSNGIVLSSNGFPETTLQSQDPNSSIYLLNQSYISTPPQATSYKLITNPNYILSPTLQTTYASIPSYTINQSQPTSQPIIINNDSNIIDSNTMLYQTLPNQLSMDYKADQSIMLSPPSQSSVNFYNL